MTRRYKKEVYLANFILSLIIAGALAALTFTKTLGITLVGVAANLYAVGTICLIAGLLSAILTVIALQIARRIKKNSSFGLSSSTKTVLDEPEFQDSTPEMLTHSAYSTETSSSHLSAPQIINKHVTFNESLSTINLNITKFKPIRKTFETFLDFEKAAVTHLKDINNIGMALSYKGALYPTKLLKLDFVLQFYLKKLNEDCDLKIPPHVIYLASPDPYRKSANFSYEDAITTIKKKLSTEHIIEYLKEKFGQGYTNSKAILKKMAAIQSLKEAFGPNPKTVAFLDFKPELLENLIKTLIAPFLLDQQSPTENDKKSAHFNQLFEGFFYHSGRFVNATLALERTRLLLAQCIFQPKFILPSNEPSKISEVAVMENYNVDNPEELFSENETSLFDPQVTLTYKENDDGNTLCAHDFSSKLELLYKIAYLNMYKADPDKHPEYKDPTQFIKVALKAFYKHLDNDIDNYFYSVVDNSMESDKPPFQKSIEYTFIDAEREISKRASSLQVVEDKGLTEKLLLSTERYRNTIS